MEGNSIDWNTLARLRERFLQAKSGAGVYWQTEEDLAHYHAFFAQRIGWKWQNALEEATLRGFEVRSGKLLDWGCGTGIATLSLLEHFPDAPVHTVLLWDHSLLACRFAQAEIQAKYPHLKVEIASSPNQLLPLEDTLVLVSHALNELTQESLANLTQQLSTASQIAIVEPGDHATSRLLIQQREALRNEFRIVAPCTICDRCPMLAEENSHHWCHFFGKPPIEAFTEGDWAHFATIMEIDLRSLPYSCLFLEKKTLPPSSSQPVAANGETESRLIGRPRQFKGYTRFLSCDSDGLRELELQKRDDKDLWKSLKKSKDGSLYHWEKGDGDRVKSGHPLHPER